MFDGVAVMELAAIATVLLFSGAVAGFLAGLLGIGGGAVLVPVFYQMFGAMGVEEAVRMHLSVGTSLAIIVPTSISSFRAHMAKGAVDRQLLKDYLIAVPVGVALAAIITAYISGAGLRGIFAVIAVLVGLKMLFAQDYWRLGDDIPDNPVRFLAGAGIGFVSTFMGIGGGILNNTFMTLFGRKMHQAVATSSGVGVLISLPGAIGYVIAGWGAEGLALGSLGFVNLIALIVILPVSLYVAPLGANVAHALSKRHLELAFGFFMLIVAARFGYSLFA